MASWDSVNSRRLRSGEETSGLRAVWARVADAQSSSIDPVQRCGRAGNRARRSVSAPCSHCAGLLGRTRHTVGGGQNIGSTCAAVPDRLRTRSGTHRAASSRPGQVAATQADSDGSFSPSCSCRHGGPLCVIAPVPLWPIFVAIRFAHLGRPLCIVRPRFARWPHIAKPSPQGVRARLEADSRTPNREPRTARL
jgi:hypothetical protein